MTRHRWRYEGGRLAQRNTCERCGLELGWWHPAPRRVRTLWLQAGGTRGRLGWPIRKPLPPCVEVKK